jgi:hypothetical protein
MTLPSDSLLMWSEMPSLIVIKIFFDFENLHLKLCPQILGFFQQYFSE